MEHFMANQENKNTASPSITMHAQYIKDLSFENPRASAVFTKQTGQPDVEVGVNVGGSPLDDDRYEISLNLNAKATVDSELLFLVELSYGGIVSVNNISDKDKNPFIMIEGPRLLFPFARATIANVTREGGFLPLNIQPIDFVAVFKSNFEAKQANKTKE
jgi:preprotein translocase subunit SecB